MSRTALELNSEIVRAGAGAGKTTRLTAKVLEIAEIFFKEKKRAPRILVTTFTRKATEELRERLVREACKGGNSQAVDFVSSHGNLHISTIHGVLSLFLRRYGHLINFDSGFTIVESSQAKRISRKVLRDILIRNTKYEELLEHYSFDHLVSLVQDYSDANQETLNLQPYSNSELLSLLTTERARVAKKLESVASQILAETSHPKWLEYAQHILNCSELHLSGKDWYERIAMCSKPRFMSKSPPFLESLSEELKLVLLECESLAAPEYEPVNIKLYAELSQIFSELGQLYAEEYSKIKYEHGQLEMKDLEYVSIRAIREFPEVAQAFSSEWDFWLIDEFQDTSPSQVELLHHLIGSRPVFVVGDPQQSIYLFRGARSEVFAEEEQAILKKNGEFSELKKNYRSEPELLLYFNDFFKQFNSNFLEMEPREPALNGDRLVATFQIVPKDFSETYLPLIGEILDKISLGAKFEDFCVLARTNRELQDIAQFFESKNIPTHVHSSDGFFKRREVLDVLSLLKFLLNPLDNLNFIRLVRSPWLKIEDQDLAQVLSEKSTFYWSHVKLQLASHSTILKLDELLSSKNKIGIYETLRAAIINLGLVDASHFHDPTGRRESNIWKFLSLLREREKTPGFSYLNFVHKAFQGQKSVEGDEETDAVAALEPNRVNLMTIHKAKGLKFKHVLIPNLGKRLTTSESRAHESPFIVNSKDKKFTIALRLGEEHKLVHNLAAQYEFSLMSTREREEHLRVLYVAMTRAEQSVTLHWQESPYKGSWASLLNWNLDEGVHKTKNYSYRVQKSFESNSSMQLSGESKSLVRAPWLLDQSELFSHQRLSVSRLVEERMAEKVALNSGIPETVSSLHIDQKNIKRHLETPVLGQKLHTLLERMKYQPDIDVKSYARRWFAEKSQDFIQAVNYVLKLNEPPVRELIENGEVEWGFQLLTSRGVMEGQIDLWGTLVDQEHNKSVTWIIDYKSGTSKYSQKAFEQLKLYACALRSFGIDHEIRLAVIYVVENKTEIQTYSDITI